METQLSLDDIHKVIGELALHNALLRKIVTELQNDKTAKESTEEK